MLLLLLCSTRGSLMQHGVMIQCFCTGQGEQAQQVLFQVDVLCGAGRLHKLPVVQLEGLPEETHNNTVYHCVLMVLPVI